MSTAYRASHLLVKHRDSRNPTSWKCAHVTRSREEAVALINELRTLLLSGGNFAHLCAIYSDCRSAHRGGDLGTFGAGKMQPAFEKAVAALTEGMLSTPVHTDSGVHLIVRTNPKTCNSPCPSRTPEPTAMADELESEVGPLPKWASVPYPSLVLEEYDLKQPQPSRALAQFELGKRSRYVMGRWDGMNNTVHIQIDENSVARIHACLVHTCDGEALTLIDLGAGVRVRPSRQAAKEKQIAAKTGVKLKEGYAFRLGTSSRLFVVTGLKQPAKANDAQPESDAAAAIANAPAEPPQQHLNEEGGEKVGVKRKAESAGDEGPAKKEKT